MPDILARFTYADLIVGQKAEFAVLLDEEMVAHFADLSGDKSPLHTDPSYAAETQYGRPVAHGMIAGMLFSRLVGMELPGTFAVYLSQSMKFHQPMFPGDTLLVSGTVTEKNDTFHTMTMKTEVIDKRSGKLFVDGEALVRVIK